VTFAPVWVLAHRLGSVVLGVDPDAAPMVSPETMTPPPTDSGLWESLKRNLAAMGKPLITGLAILAVVCSIATYGLIMLGWRLHTWWQWRRRGRNRQF
jgi:uncharacterized protein (DUF2062 family)